MIPKFRVWLKDVKEMYTVITMHIEHEKVICEHWRFGETVPLSYRDDKDVVLMQSTGLTDKNGTEIYEGDIVEFKYPYDKRVKTLGSIVWREDKACFGIDMKETTEKYELYRITSEHYLTVVGNIYEHSHLLEGDNHASN